MATREPTTQRLPAEAATWREQAVARSLDPARVRAEQRVQRFLDAALALVDQGNRDFTVQEVVERSGQSLRSFYQYFGGKHELVLALFEDAVAAAVEILREAVDREDDPFERLHLFVTSYFKLCRPGRQKGTVPSAARALAEFAQPLQTAQPVETSRALAPLVSLLDELIAGAEASGSIRPGLREGTLATVLLEAVLFTAQAGTRRSPIPAGADPAEELWDLILHGIGSTS